MGDFRILLLADHKWRDLPGLAYAKVLLERRHGHQVWIAHPRHIRQYVRICRPHLVVMNSNIGSLHQYAIKLKRAGCLVAVLPTEGAARVKAMSDYVAGRYMDFSPVDLCFAWGPAVRDEMLKCSNMDPGRIVISGVPRFDFYRMPLRRYLMSKRAFCERHRLDPNRAIVTWTTNFVCMKFRLSGDRGVEWFQDCLDNSNMADVEGCDSAERLIDIDVMYFDATRRLIRDMMERLPDVSLVIKAHPAENPEPYREFIRELPAGRACLVTNLYIWDVLNISDILLQRLCTTAMEMWLLGKATFEMHPVEHDIWRNAEGESGSEVIRTSDELAGRAQYYLTGGAIPDGMRMNRERILQKYYHDVDGRRTEFMVDSLHELLAERRPNPCYRDWEALRGADWIKHRLDIPFEQSLLSWSKGEEYVSPSDAVQGQEDRIASGKDVEWWTWRMRDLVRAAGPEVAST